MTDVPTLRIVEAGELRFAWLAVRDRVAKVADEMQEGWIADDVFHQIVSRKAFLWVTPEYRGFVVLKVGVTDYTSELEIWIADNDTMARAPDYWPQLRDIATRCECRRMMFISNRKGWQRTMPNLGVSYLYFEDL